MKILCLLIFTAVGAWAQGCGILTLNPATGLLDCTGPASTATGTVTSATVAGTANQITASGTCTITTSGTCTLSLSSTLLVPGTLTSATNGAASTPPVLLTGTWFTGGSATTTKPQLLVEPSGTTSTGWNTSGTGLGVNAASGFAGYLADLQVAGTTKLSILANGNIQFADGSTFGNSNPGGSGVRIQGASGAYVQVQLIPLGGGDSIFYLYKNQDPAFKVTNNILQLSDAAGGAFDVGISRSGAGVLTVDTTTGGNALGTASMAGLVVSGATITLSGLGSATGTPDSVCLNTNTLKRNAALTCTVSSRNEKTSIESLPVISAVEMVDKLRPVEFAYRDYPGRMRYGLIAEEVADVDPKLADGWSANGPRSLDQNALISLLIKAAQEEHIQIQELKDQVRRLSK